MNKPTPQGPARWWVALDGVQPENTRVEAVHAALSHWFDSDAAQHSCGIKPYSITPITHRRGSFGVEIGTLSAQATVSLLRSAESGRPVRFDAVRAHVSAPPTMLLSETWADLATYSGAYAWEFAYQTPMTIHSGQRYSPLPVPASFLGRLERLWNAHADHDPIELTREDRRDVWVSALAGESVQMQLSIGRRAHTRGRSRPTPVTVSGLEGNVSYRCSEPETAAKVDRLLRFAVYAGTGALTEHGLGVSRLLAIKTRSNRPGPQASPVVVEAAPSRLETTP